MDGVGDHDSIDDIEKKVGTMAVVMVVKVQYNDVVHDDDDCYDDDCYDDDDDVDDQLNHNSDGINNSIRLS